MRQGRLEAEEESKSLVAREDDAFMARCLDVEVTSDGATAFFAVEALKEALMLYLEGHPDTLAKLWHEPAVLARLGADRAMIIRGFFTADDTPSLTYSDLNVFSSFR